MLTSLKTLLSSIVDYAGLFPPAKLSLEEAMANYAQDQLSAYNWMLGRFVLPASRLPEFESLLPTFPLKQWPLSLILSGNLHSEIEKVRSLTNPQIAVTALEIPPLSPTEIELVLPHLPAGVDTFFEIPLNPDLETYLLVLQQHAGTGAKIRTGGLSVEAFPSLMQLCQCLFSFAKAQVPFKATAGLHHPLPANYALTYEPDSPSTVMHGFLNVAVLAAFIYWQKVTPEESLDILKVAAIDRFRFAAEGIAWGDRHLTLTEIAQTRQCFFRSFGSCSFQEPIDDLKQLKLL